MERHIVSRVDGDEVALRTRVRAIHAETGRSYASRRMAELLQGVRAPRCAHLLRIDLALCSGNRGEQTAGTRKGGGPAR
jgi:hypothetical protein